MKKEKNSFKTPEGYFDSFTDKLMTKLSIEETINSKQDGFKVPEDYFETLHEKIEQKIAAVEPNVIQLNSFKKQYLVAASIAAILVLFIGVKLSNSPSLTFEDIANSDIENYFGSDELGLSSYDIAEMIAVDELEIKDIINNHLNDENVIDYLNNSIDDFEELNLENNE
tara:strand:- start:163183 stop:163689 length:507 start_codon:yes stop_codon:yes gene_type:complete